MNARSRALRARVTLHVVCARAARGLEHAWLESRALEGAVRVGEWRAALAHGFSSDVYDSGLYAGCA